MTRNSLLYLQDITEAIDKIERYTNGLTYTDFEKSDMVIDAVVRNLEVIGEAAGHIPDDIYDRYPEIPWHKMKAMRNIMAHEYSGWIWK